MPRYLVTGSKGQLGQCFHSIQSEFPQYQLLFASQSEVDITQVQTLSNYLNKHPLKESLIVRHIPRLIGLKKMPIQRLK